MSPLEPRIRTANAADAPALSDVHAAAFAPLGQAPWAAEAFRTLLGLPTTTALTIEDETGIAAVIVGQAAADTAEIVTLATRPAAQGQGLARALLDALLARYTAFGLDKVFLEVMAGNAKALSLYRRAGFNKVGERKNYYKDIRTGRLRPALVLAKELEYLPNASAIPEVKRENLDSVSTHRSKPK